MSTTRGFVISSMKYKESSKILTLYTEELGKIKVLAQGVMKPKSQNLASSEVFTLSNWKLKKGRSFYYIESVDLLDSFYTLRNSMQRMIFGFYALELLDKSTPVEEENSILFQLLDKYLNTLRSQEELLSLLVSYELKFASFIGYRPHLDGCLACGSRNSEMWGFDSTKGGLVCSSCSAIMGDPITKEEILCMKKLLMSKLDETMELGIKIDILWRIHNRISGYLLYNLDLRELKSLSMIRQDVMG